LGLLKPVTGLIYLLLSIVAVYKGSAVEMDFGKGMRIADSLHVVLFCVYKGLRFEMILCCVSIGRAFDLSFVS